MELCLFCDEKEKSYQPKTEFVCSGCALMLCGADQEDLKRAYNKALDLGIEKGQGAINVCRKGGCHCQKRKPKTKSYKLCKTL